MSEIDCHGDWDCEVEHYRAHTVFPDFMKPETRQWWYDMVTDFHHTIAFDGLWIDMNEAANFVTGSTRGCDYEDPLESPPYLPKIFGPVLADKTICMASLSHNTDTTKTYQYNMHSLFGWSQNAPTLTAARQSTGKRSIVVSRSTFPGSGTNSGHWLGDNTSIWPHMHKSIIGMLEFNLFGVPYIGADICGFFEDTTEELCLRWTQLGAFYPYARNHNSLGNIPQDPAAFGPEFASYARDVLHVRYTLLPYLYTLFFLANQQGETVVRPLMQEFTSDLMTRTIDRQFLWGPALLISPVLDEGAVTVEAYMTDARWFDYYTGAEVPTRGKYTTLNAPLDYIPLHVRGGYIIPTQQPANTTVISRQLPMGLIVSLDDTYTASGSLFWDEGDTIDSIESNDYFLEQFTATSNQVNSIIMMNAYVMDPLVLDDVYVYGLENTDITRVLLNGVELNIDNWSVDATLNVLAVNSMGHPMDETLKLMWE
uniref:Maltase-glucoamylase, intestinal-like n=1 Tax=Saccoglossus kowalevskii TaxID=10224 RepID=A0ABM0N0K6_SACKO|nr:PREDICTED: maltase-glucoamylase, intestinal-like [Saccoglossus kowalevskii]